MAELFQHGRPLRRLINRWRVAGNLGSRARIDEMPSWIQPSIRADRDWDDDEREVWGISADASTLGLATNFPAVAIFAGAREVHVRKVDFMILHDDQSIAIAGRDANIFTPPTGYNPVAFNPGVFFPFLQGNPVIPDGTITIRFPEAIVVGGHQTGLMIVTINGVPVNPSIGPRYRMRHDFVLSAFSDTVFQTILDWNDPPLIVPPFRVLAVQYINPTVSILPAEQRILVNFWYSERSLA